MALNPVFFNSDGFTIPEMNPVTGGTLPLRPGADLVIDDLAVFLFGQINGKKIVDEAVGDNPAMFDPIQLDSGVFLNIADPAVLKYQTGNQYMIRSHGEQVMSGFAINNRMIFPD